MIHLLFLCPHAAGKSLAAATYFRAAAADRGLDVQIRVAGPDPDPGNMPDVVAALTAQGHSIGWEPARLRAADVAEADVVVSIGCSAEDVPATPALQQWHVPALSEDFTGAMNAIRTHAEDLAAELAPG